MKVIYLAMSAINITGVTVSAELRVTAVGHVVLRKFFLNFILYMNVNYFIL